MSKHNTALSIRVIGDKVVQGASKGRNQWLLLRQFDGRTVGDFTEAAKAHTRQSPPGTYQQGSWWNRELSYCLDKGVIRLIDSCAWHTVPKSVTVTISDAKPNAEAEAIAGGSASRLPATALSGTSSSSPASGSGLYLVTLNNSEPISTNAADPRIADRCATVNRDNCKFGQARDFARRRGNYEDTFGASNVSFFVIAAVAETDLDTAERCVLQQLTRYKIRGPSGYRLEWLKGINPEQVIAVALQALAVSGIRYRKLV